MSADKLIEHVCKYAVLLINRGEVSKLRAVQQVREVLATKNINVSKSTIEHTILRLQKGE